MRAACIIHTLTDPRHQGQVPARHTSAPTPVLAVRRPHTHRHFARPRSVKVPREPDTPTLRAALPEHNNLRPQNTFDPQCHRHPPNAPERLYNRKKKTRPNHANQNNSPVTHTPPHTYKTQMSAVLQVCTLQNNRTAACPRRLPRTQMTPHELNSHGQHLHNYPHSTLLGSPHPTDTSTTPNTPRDRRQTTTDHYHCSSDPHRQHPL